MKDIKKEIQEELEALAPSLSKMEKNDGFDIPKNYFEGLSDQVMSQLDFPKTAIEEEIKIDSKSISWSSVLMEKIAIFFQPKIAVGFAMMTILMLSVYFFSQKNNNAIVPFADLSEDEMETYIQENIEDFDEDVLFEMVVENEIDKMELNAEEEELDNYIDEIIDEVDLDELL